jgi:hypothetical protein
MGMYIDVENTILGIDMIKDYRMLADMQTGAWYWGKPNSEITIWASPNWDMDYGKCAVQIDGYYESEKHEVSDGYSFDLGTPYDLEAQIQKYVDVITAIIEALEKPYESFDQILENVLPKFN